MTVTYDITTIVGKIRLAIGDTDTTDYVFTDEELTLFYDTEGSINLAAAAACEAWAAKYAVNADDEKIGDYSYKQTIVKKLLDLATRLRDKESAIPTADISSYDLTGGSAITEEED